MARLVWGEQSIEIIVRGYSEPDLPVGGAPVSDDWGANWMDVRVVASDGVETWIMDGPFLITWEVLGFADWFERVADGENPKWGPGSVDEYPDFELSDDRQSIEVQVQHWIFEDLSTGDTWGEVRFPRDAEAMRRFAAELRSEVVPYPVRVIEANGAATRALATLKSAG